jgi:hypothetical protein
VATCGSVVATCGSVVATCGSVVATCGSVVATCGSVVATAVKATSGDWRELFILSPIDQTAEHTLNVIKSLLRL